MISFNLNERHERYLDRSTDNRSAYVRELIEKDMKRTQPDDPFEEYQRCKQDIIHFVKQYGYYKNQTGGIEPVSFLFNYQKDILEDLASGENVIIRKGRKKRMTTTIAHFILWKMIFDPQTEIFSKSADTTNTKNLNWKLPFKTGYENLPGAFKVGFMNENKRAPKLSNGSWILTNPEEVYAPDVSIFEEAGFWNPDFNISFDSQTVITYTTEKPRRNPDSEGRTKMKVKANNEKKLESLHEMLEYKSYDLTKS